MRRLKNVWDQKRGIWQPRITEEHVLREIVERLSWAKIEVFRINCPVGGKVRPNAPGLPDLMGWVPSDLNTVGVPNDANPITTFRAYRGAAPLYIEVKRPGGARRTAQIRFIEEARKGGCLAFFAESWDDVVRNLKESGINLKYEVGGKQ